MKTLYTAFKGKNNASCQFVDKISGVHLFLTNSFMGLEKDIASITGDFDRIYMFGVDKTLKNAIRVEKCAGKEKQLLYTNLELEQMIEKMKKSQITCYVSDVPASYLCNAAYYEMLRHFSGKALFIHIPTAKNFSNELESSLLSLMLEL